MAVYANGFERQIRIKYFITLELVTIAPVKSSQVRRRNLRKNSAYRIDTGFLLANKAFDPFRQAEFHIQGVQTAQSGQVHNEAAPQDGLRTDSGR